MNRTELGFRLRLIPFLDSVESLEDGMVRLRDRRWLVWHPDVMSALFRNDRDLRHPPSRTLSPLLGNRSVLWLDGAEHTAYRRTLTPALRGNRYQALIEEMVERSIAALPSGPTSLPEWTRKLALRIIGRIVFGVDDDELLAAFTRWLDRRLGSRVRTLAHRCLTPGSTRSDPHLDAMLLHRARTAEPPALAAFLPPGDLRDQVVSLLFAGHETTASATAWTLYWISRTPGLAERLDDDLLEATIRESLRLSPPATLAGNRMSADGMVITPSIYLAHRRAATYENPHVFDPARRPPPPGAFFPFGGGVRHCPGRDLALLEIRLIVTALLRHKHIKLSSPTCTPQLRGAAMAPPPSLAMVATCRR
ncbi:cytochrome P450 [Lentzea albidocapillata]|uniref:Cytochrome P450 n=1 Tax=Lentzea albidocapillata TaxID=40571 RepID=A0A1W2FN83_9PSEU|nr:cytochrome P450 [Lentzea albidocapillata]SMD23224.1 Cytochrome P450 [Lentzea albidocapillata]